MDISDMGARSSSESSMVSSTFGESTTADFNEDTECLIRADQTGGKTGTAMAGASNRQGFSNNFVLVSRIGIISLTPLQFTECGNS